ncbi:MAG: O-antigen ligase family protein [bacterium]|nr:O-antigen ligase family protein [bacterium]
MHNAHKEHTHLPVEHRPSSRPQVSTPTPSTHPGDVTLRFIIIAGIFLLPFVCLIIANHSFFPFITGKNFTFRIIVEVITVLWLILAVRDRSALPRSSKLLQSFAVFLGVIFISDLLSPNSFKSFWSNYERMEGFVTLAHLFALFVVASSMMTRKLWNWFFHTAVGVGIFLFFYSLLQLNHELVINQGGVRLDGTFGNATYLAIFMVFLIFFAISSFADKENPSFRPALTSGFIGIGFSFLYPFYQYFSKIFDFYWLYRHLPNQQEQIANNIHFFTGPYGRNLFWISLLGLAALCALWFNEKNFGGKTRSYVRGGLYILIILADLFVLYNTASRGPILGLIGGLFLSALLLAVFDRGEVKLRKTAVGIIAAIVVLIGTFMFVKDADFVKNSQVLQRFSSLSFTDKTTESRFMIWNMAWQGFKERPIFGWGQESFNYVFNKYYDPKMYGQEQWFDRTHNVFFDWLVAGGLLGVISYLSLFGLALYYLWRKGGPFSFLERSLVTGLFAAYFFHNLTVFDNITSYILFVLVLAWINSCVGSSPLAVAKNIFALDAGTKNRVLIPIIAVAAVFVLYKVNVPALLASKDLISALSANQVGPALNLTYFKKALSRRSLGDSEIHEQLVQKTSQAAETAGLDPKIKNDFFNLTRSEMLRQIEQTPDDARYHLFMGSFLSSFGDSDGAIGYLQKAHELSPKKQTILFSLGSVYLGKGDYEKGAEILKLAFDLEPSFGEARRIYAVALIYAKQGDLAAEVLKPLPVETVLADQRVIRAYFLAGYFDKALEGVNFTLEKDPSNIQYHFTRASILNALGQKTAAIAALNKIAEINPATRGEVDQFIKKIRAGESI